MVEALAQRRRGGGDGSGSMLAAWLWWRRVEDTGGNSDGVGTYNNQQGCGSGVRQRLGAAIVFVCHSRRHAIEDTGGNSDGVGTDNNQQGCGSGVGSGRLPPLFLFPSSLSSLSSLPFPSLLQLLF